MAVRTVLPRHAMSRGRPTLTESKRGNTFFPTMTPQFEQVNANDKMPGRRPSAFGHDTWQLGFAQRVCNGSCVTSASSRILAALNCTRDEGGPFEFGNQVLISSHRKLLRSRAGVVSVAETPGR